MMFGLNFRCCIVKSHLYLCTKHMLREDSVWEGYFAIRYQKLALINWVGKVNILNFSGGVANF
jgi:hypothetical protein